MARLKKFKFNNTDYNFPVEDVKVDWTSVMSNGTANIDLSWKQNTLDTQTAYTAKGTGQKVPQITTNNLWQVTNITEVNIDYPQIISDVAYGSSWNWDTTQAPSKNAVYDKISSMDTTIAGKQNTLTPGTWIWINWNTISNTWVTSVNWQYGDVTIQTGGNYTAGNWIDITNDEIWLDGTYEWKDYTAMQWPAPSGFHVPLTTEWQAVYDVWTALGGWSSDWTNFWIALKLPFAGYRNYGDASVSEHGSTGYYWSSSRYYSYSAYKLLLVSTALRPQDSDTRARGLSVRCFRNSPAIPNSSWTKLYWTSIEAGGIFWSSADWLISLSSDWTTWITIADKNLWATTVWNSWDTLSEANCWKYYQRWNNYWFPRTWTIANQSTTQVDASSYWPWNYYSSDTFIKYNWRWDTTDNWNLWWWVTWIQTVSWNLVVWDQLYKIVTSTSAPASWTSSNVITIVTD